MDAVTELWDAVKLYAVSIWNNQPSGLAGPDGWAAWQPIKALLENVPGVGIWSPDYLSLISDNGEIGPAPLSALERNEREGGTAGEDAHFLAQLLRIPAREKCSLLRVLQVSYNVGQLVGSGALIRLSANDPTWEIMYEKHKLTRLETYCNSFEAFQIPADLLTSIKALCPAE